VSAATGSDAPETGTLVSGELGSFEVTRSDAVKVPVLAGSKATSTVHWSPAAIVADPEPHGLEPPLTLREKLGDAPAASAMLETCSGALPAFLTVTSRGAGTLLDVTLPKS
jgi:hypothetical protein